MGVKANYFDGNCQFDWLDTSQDDGYALTAPVGSYPLGASPYGALDMAGNVWEWMADWYSEDYYHNAPYDDPIGPVTGNHRVLRGGSWYYNDIGFLRVYSRFSDDPDKSNLNYGFRCVVDP